MRNIKDIDNEIAALQSQIDAYTGERQNVVDYWNDKIEELEAEKAELLASGNANEPVTSASTAKSFTRGTPKQFINALNNKIVQLGGESAIESSTGVDDMYAGADYFEALRHKVSDKLKKEHSLLVESYNELECIRFGVYAKDTHKEFAEYSIDKSDIVPNIDDLTTDVDEVVRDIVSMIQGSEASDLFYDDEDLEDGQYE